MCTYPFAKKTLTLHLARGEGRERYFGCNLMQRKVLASSHQHLTLIAKSSKHENAKQPHWGAGKKLVLGYPLAATIGDSARCMQNLEKVLFTGPKTSDTVTFICD